MTGASSNTDNPNQQKHLFGWMLFLVALFPLVALLTYDWHAIPGLCTPTAPSSNWIGALGDWFAYYGYLFFGLAVWIVPILCAAIAGIRLIGGRKLRSGRRELLLTVFLTSVACLMQVIQSHAPGLQCLLSRLNLANAGGVIGYLLMTRFLSPLLSDFGSSVIMLIVMTISLVAAIGLRNLTAFFIAIYRWATVGKYMTGQPPDSNDATAEASYDAQQAAYLAALQAKADAKRQREMEKAAAKAEKEAAKQAAAEAKAAAKAAKETAKQAAAETKAAAPAGGRGETAATEDKGPYILPSLALLNPIPKSSADHGDVGEMSQKLIDTLKIFGIDAEMSYTVQGPVVTKYAIRLAPGTRYSTVTNIQDNIKGALHAKSLRIEAPIPGEECVGIEVPNRAAAGISFREVFESEDWRKNATLPADGSLPNYKIPLLLGKDAAGKNLIADLASMPHMLVAGATGQGKSVCLNAIINGLLMSRTPEQLKLIMVDPKSVEFSSYASIPHLLVPVITDNRKVVFSLHWAVAEMEKRLKMFSKVHCKNIVDFNTRKTFTQTDMFGEESVAGGDLPRTVPYIVIIIDEVADLMASNGKEVTPDISRLTAKARAAGIHLILATQRPDAKIITGTIKANIPGRVAFKTASSIDSRTILDDSGAENLIGRGDMLFKTKDGLLVRAQGAWISDPEIANVTRFIEQHANTQFDETFATKLGRVKEAGITDPFAANEDDPDNQQSSDGGETGGATERELVKAAADADDFKKAVECIINTNRASTSHFQRRLGWGYNHAAKILDMLEDRGIVGPQSGAGPRQIIMDQQQLLAIFNGGGASGEPEAQPSDETPQDLGSPDSVTEEQ